MAEPTITHRERRKIEAGILIPMVQALLDDRRASHIAACRKGSINAPAETRAELLRWSIENLLRLKEVVLPKAKAILSSTEPAQ